MEQIPRPRDYIAEVMAIKNRCMAMGANDYEGPALDNIIKKLISGQYKNPDEAVSEAMGIVNSKQSYH